MLTLLSLSSVFFSWIIEVYIDLNIFFRVILTLFLTLTNASLLTYKICFKIEEKDTIKKALSVFFSIK